MRVFYIINENLFDDRVFAYGEQVDQKTGDYPKSEVCGAAVGMREWLSPLKVKLSKPSYGDMVFETFPAFLASEEFMNEFIASDLKGIDLFRPVEVVREKNKKLNLNDSPQYYYPSIKLGGARIDELKSSFVRDGEVDCNYCRNGIINSFKGIYIMENSWKGDDIFFPIGLSGTVIVSARFHEFVVKNRFTNINLIPAEKYLPPWN